jgi:hypothetical protein
MRAMNELFSKPNEDLNVKTEIKSEKSNKR